MKLSDDLLGSEDEMDFIKNKQKVNLPSWHLRRKKNWTSFRQMSFLHLY